MFDTMQHKTSGAKILEDFISTSPEKAALAVEQMALSEAVFWVSGLRASAIISCLENMNPKKAAFLLRRLHIKQAARIMQGLKAERAGEIMLNLPIHYKKRLIDTLAPGQIKALEDVLNYPQDSAARIMKNDFVSFKTDAKVKDIIAKIKALPAAKVPLSIYILDKAGKLSGVLPTSHLSFYSAESLAGSVMTTDFAKLSPFDSLVKAQKALSADNTALLPVADEDGTLLGVVSLWALKNFSAPKATPTKVEKKTNYLWLYSILALVLLVIIIFAIFKFI